MLYTGICIMCRRHRPRIYKWPIKKTKRLCLNFIVMVFIFTYIYNLHINRNLPTARMTTMVKCKICTCIISAFVRSTQVSQNFLNPCMVLGKTLKTYKLRKIPMLQFEKSSKHPTDICLINYLDKLCLIPFFT